MPNLSGRFAIQVVRGNSDGTITIQTYEVNERMIEEVVGCLGSEPIGEYIAPATMSGFDQRLQL